MSIKKHTVSILTYNRNVLFELCLQSLLKQTVRPNEILIIDQNPTQKLKEIIDQYGYKNKEIIFTYIHMRKPHISKGRKEALQKAKYNYLLFTDDDCVVDKNWSYNALLSLGKKNPLVAGRCLINRKESNEVSITLHEMTEIFFSLYRNNSNNKHTQSYLMDPKNCAINRNVLLKHNIMYNEKQFWLEDVDLSFQAYSKKIPIFFNKKMAVTHTYTKNIVQALRGQFRLGYAFQLLLARWAKNIHVRALYISTSYLYEKRKHSLYKHHKLLIYLFSVARNVGYSFGTMRSIFLGT